MTSSYLRSRKARHGKPRPHGDAQGAGAANQVVKKQLDGSRVTSPPDDPVNSEETLKRNQKGNS